MYTEEYEKKGFPILRTILKVLIIGIIILLLILFIPKLIKNSSSSNNNGNNGTSGSNSNCSDKYEKSLDALTSQIFADNLEKMKDAAVSYYTTERLPENVGDSDTMTLSDMIGKKLIVALIDKNNKAVDVEKSYVKITKTDEEYILKVNIKDSEKEDYILVHLGCYSYCKTDICEKNTKSTKDVPIKGSKPTPVVTIKKSYSDNPSYEEEKYYCKYVNGKYYDNGGNRVSELTYLKLCEAPVCRKVNGYYFDSKGNNVTKYKYEKDCYSKPTPTPTYKCVYKNGRYYDAKGNVVSKVDYLISCEKPKCKIIDGYYFGKNGNVVTKPTYEKECSSKPTPTYKCVYKNGKYYDAKGNVVSKVNYLISCEKPKCKIIDGYYFGKKGNVVTKSTYEKECSSKPTPTPTYKCVYKNGKYYDAKGNVVSKVDYLISCEKPKCKIIDGYYFGKNGNVVTKPTYEKECSSKPTPTPTYKCVYKNGKYYDAKGNVVSKVDYLISCEKPKCKIIDGYYFGKNGNSVSKSTYEKECKPKEYEYEYTKTTDNKFSEWSAWSSWSKTDCSTSEINCNDSDATCLNKLQLLKRKEQIGTYKKSYARERNVVKQTGSYIEKSCSKYNYVEINKTIYATKTTTTYTVINTITSSTQSSTGAWTYNGRASYSNPPRDTNSTHYKFVGADYSYCGDTCTSLPNYYYDSYSYTGGLTKVSSTTVPGNSTSSTTSTTSKEYEASCGGYTYKTIPIYGTITVTDKATRDEPLYGNVCYKSTKNRNLIEKGSTKAKWSSYNDTKLLNSGWTYSGRKRLK